MQITEKGTLLMRNHIGSAEGEGKSYDLATSLNGSPMVQSSVTGRTFHLAWDDIVKLAIEAGIDNEPEDQ